MDRVTKTSGNTKRLEIHSDIQRDIQRDIQAASEVARSIYTYIEKVEATTMTSECHNRWIQ